MPVDVIGLPSSIEGRTPDGNVGADTRRWRDADASYTPLTNEPGAGHAPGGATLMLRLRNNIN